MNRSTNRSTGRMGITWARRALVGILTAALLVGASGVAMAAPTPDQQSQSG